MYLRYRYWYTIFKFSDLFLATKKTCWKQLEKNSSEYKKTFNFFFLSAVHPAMATCREWSSKNRLPLIIYFCFFRESVHTAPDGQNGREFQTVVPYKALRIQSRLQKGALDWKFGVCASNVCFFIANYTFRYIIYRHKRCDYMYSLLKTLQPPPPPLDMREDDISIVLNL